METKNLTAQRQFVTDLLEEYCHQNGLYNYKLVFDRRLTRLGACQWKRMKGFPEKWDITFYFSDKYLVTLSDREIEKTVTHEVAHAITPANERPHGAVWRANDLRMGGDGTRCHNDTEEQSETLSKYRGECAQGHKYYRKRKNHETTYYCPTCAQKKGGYKKLYDSYSLLTWTTLR